MTEIITSDRQVYRHAKAVVAVADALRDADFEVVDYLRCEELRITVAPEIDQATLTYQYGDLVRENTFAVDRYLLQELQGKYVKVTAEDTVYADAFAADPDTDEVDLSIVWFGVIDFNASSAMGSQGTHTQGVQQFIAFGMGRIAEQCVVETSIVDVDNTEANMMTSLSGLRFNLDDAGDFNSRGNRSAFKPVDGDSDPGPSYVFSWFPRGQPLWTAYTAVQYLLAHHSPKDAAGNVPNVWRFADDVDEDYLDWYEITQETHGLTLKQLLDALMPRHRAVGYWLEFDPATDEVLVHVFTFNKTDIALPNGQTLKANANQRSLDFETAYDIEEAYITNVSAQYHRIVAQGARRTTTFTTRIGSLGTWNSGVMLGPSWASADETEYKAGASAAADYSGLSDDQKAARNSVYRKSSERLHQVFRRFVLNTQNDESKRWDGKIFPPHKASTDRYWLRGDISAGSFTALVDPESEYDGRDYVPALRIRRSLPLYERVDYSGTNLSSFSYDNSSGTHPSFIPLMAYARTQTGDADIDDVTSGQQPHRYQLLDRLHQAAYFATERRWACQVGVCDTEPGVELVADPPHFIGGKTAGAGSGWALTADNELSADNGGLDYGDIWVTLCVELTEHLKAEKVLSEPPTDAPEKVLMFDVPDARHDYVVPYTIVEIKDGLPVPTTSGGVVPTSTGVSSIDRLNSIVRCAAEWYSLIRQALRLKWKQTRASFQLGWLITDVGRYQLTNINTPITAITYDFGAEHDPGSPTSGSTTIETAFTNLDFQT